MVLIEQTTLKRDEGLQLIVLKPPRNVCNPWRHILQGDEYLVGCVPLAGLDMNVKYSRADSGVRGFGALAPHPGRHGVFSADSQMGVAKKNPVDSVSPHPGRHRGLHSKPPESLAGRWMLRC